MKENRLCTNLSGKARMIHRRIAISRGVFSRCVYSEIGCKFVQEVLQEKMVIVHKLQRLDKQEGCCRKSIRLNVKLKSPGARINPPHKISFR